MLDRVGKFILVTALTLAVALGGYLGYLRYLNELQDRTVELCVDLNDIKQIATYEKKALGPVLDKLSENGIISVGLFEETLPDAAAKGELYYTSGAGIDRLGDFNPLLSRLRAQGKIKSDRTYLYAPSDVVRKRIYDQLQWAIGKESIKFLGRQVMEIDESEKELRELGLGISEVQKDYLVQKGFRIIPRVWNDPRYHFGNIGPKIAALKDFDTIIFDGEKILGYPDAIDSTAQALKKNHISYGYIEIVKQDGDALLRRLMDRDVVRVHSVPKRELEKLNKDEVIKRFVRAARERKVRLFYLRPFLPPQIDAYPVAYNLDFFGRVKDGLTKAGFVMGKAEKVQTLRVSDWQLLMLGVGVAIGLLFLFNHFVRIHSFIMILLALLCGTGMYYAMNAGYMSDLQKALALLAAVTFPALAVISSFARKEKVTFLPWNGTFIVINILAETLVGVFLLTGILADYRYMLGVETFRGVKLALVLPMAIVALYFILQQGSGGLKDRIASFLNLDVKMISIVSAVLVLGGIGVFVARSGNFVLPVPGFEKYARNLLEKLLYIRPRTKEFLIGYPFIFLAAAAYLRGKLKWLWLLAALGAIAPISVMNTFSHIHTPFIISMMRTVNGLVLGIAIGAMVAFLADTFILKRGEHKS